MRENLKGYMKIKSVRIIIMIAILALFALGAYIYKLNSKYIQIYYLIIFINNVKKLFFSITIYPNIWYT